MVLPMAINSKLIGCAGKEAKDIHLCISTFLDSLVYRNVSLFLFDLGAAYSAW